MMSLKRKGGKKHIKYCDKIHVQTLDSNFLIFESWQQKTEEKLLQLRKCKVVGNDCL